MEVNRIILGKCEVVMRDFPDDSIDTIIADPPYGIKFMGKKWDYQVPTVAVWTECLRVLKPGGTLLCFAGTRTYHRMVCKIEDAGFIPKDCIMWLYGSGFPKATDISKQIDKVGGNAVGWFGKWLKEWREKNNIQQKKIAELFPSKSGGITGCVANWELGLNMPTPEQFTTICREFGLPFASIEEAEREVVGKQKNVMSGWDTDGSTKFVDRDITKPATDAAKVWDGWKSHGLKPAYEPILVAMKPNDGTYAENALKWGVAGLNIDAGRIEAPDGVPKFTQRQENSKNCYSDGLHGSNRTGEMDKTTGRYPANVILDEEAGRMLDEQSGMSGSGKRTVGGTPRKTEGFVCTGSPDRTNAVMNIGDTGGASRFFYCAKASKSERGKDNHHPTVKPLALMEYLCRITSTPTGGLVLDPFVGSGTTCLAAYRTGRDYIGIEKETAYKAKAEKRIAAEKDKLGLFQ